MTLPYFDVRVPKDAIASLDWKEVLSKVKNYIRSDTKQIMDEIKLKRSESCISGEYKP